jgi:hypothetical protein
MENNLPESMEMTNKQTNKQKIKTYQKQKNQRSSEVMVLQTKKLQHNAVHKTMCINVSSIIYGLKNVTFGNSKNVL